MIPQAVTTLIKTPTDTTPGIKGNSLDSFQIAVYNENGFYQGFSLDINVNNPSPTVSLDWRVHQDLTDLWESLNAGNYLVSLRADAFAGMPLMQSELLAFTITA